MPDHSDARSIAAILLPSGSREPGQYRQLPRLSRDQYHTPAKARQETVYRTRSLRKGYLVLTRAG